MQKLKFTIEGIASSADASSIERELQKLPSVLAVKVGRETKKAVVIYDDKKINPLGEVKKIIAQFGNLKINIKKSPPKPAEAVMRTRSENDSKPPEINRTCHNPADNGYLIMGIVTGVNVMSVIVNIILLEILIDKI